MPPIMTDVGLGGKGGSNSSTVRFHCFETKDLKKGQFLKTRDCQRQFKAKRDSRSDAAL